MNTKPHHKRSLAVLAAAIAAPVLGLANPPAASPQATPVPAPEYWLPGFWDRSDASRIWHDPSFAPQKAANEKTESAPKANRKPVVRSTSRYGAGAGAGVGETKD